MEVMVVFAFDVAAVVFLDHRRLKIEIASLERLEKKIENILVIQTLAFASEEALRREVCANSFLDGYSSSAIFLVMFVKSVHAILGLDFCGLVIINIPLLLALTHTLIIMLNHTRDFTSDL
jgi:pilus assembly protein TadC